MFSAKDAIVVLLLASAASAAEGQSLKDRLKQKAKEKAEQAAEKKDKEKDKPAAQPTTSTTAADTSPTAAPASTASDDPPGRGVWLNYDFVPGDRTIWYEDFSSDDVGDFPRRMRLKEGNLEVVDVKGKKMLRSADGGWMYVVLPEKLPERFTIEVNFHTQELTNPITLATTASPFERSATMGCYSNQAWVASNSSGGPDNSGNAFQPNNVPGFVNCTFTIDNTRGIKGYINEHRTANAPQTHVALTDTLWIQLPAAATPEDPVLVSTFRIAAGGKKLYDALAATGRVATHGILFDTGSDQLRGESTPTLKEIGQMLKDHPDLQLTIEGHTDNVGQAAANLALSQKRADAVKAHLVSTYGIDAARLTTKGLGATKPVDANDTPQGRQNNRRVELVKN